MISCLYQYNSIIGGTSPQTAGQGYELRGVKDPNHIYVQQNKHHLLLSSFSIVLQENGAIRF